MDYKIKTKSGMAGPFTTQEIAVLFRKGKIRAGTKLRGENDELLSVSEVIEIPDPVHSRWETALWLYVILCWLCSLIACGLVFSGGSAPASVPANLFLVVYFVWGLAGLGCLNVLLSIALLFMHELKSALALFLNPPVLLFIIALIIFARQ